VFAKEAKASPTDVIEAGERKKGLKGIF